MPEQAVIIPGSYNFGVLTETFVPKYDGIIKYHIDFQSKNVNINITNFLICVLNAAELFSPQEMYTSRYVDLSKGNYQYPAAFNLPSGYGGGIFVNHTFTINKLMKLFYKPAGFVLYSSERNDTFMYAFSYWYRSSGILLKGEVNSLETFLPVKKGLPITTVTSFNNSVNPMTVSAKVYGEVTTI